MRPLIPVLEVRELPPLMSKYRQHLPSLRDFASTEPTAEEAAVLGYLDKGVVCVWNPDRGYATDRIGLRRIRDACKEDPRLNGLDRHIGCWLTDGTWVWDGILPYYVAAYHVRLPEVFVRFARERGWKIDPATIDVRQLDPNAHDAIPAAAHA